MIKKKILVVDDDDFVLNVIQKALDEHPEYDAVCVNDVDNALINLSDKKFDLIITDIVMPGKDGIEFINLVRKTDQETPVIVISGGASGQKADDYINFACYFASETLTKPFSKDDLLRAIEMVLNNQHGDALRFL